MLDRLIGFALTQRLLVVLATLALIGAGWMAALQLPIDAFPDVSPTQVKIIVKAPGMTPEEVESRITIPIEQELLGLPGKRMLRSQSKYAIADITLDFDDGTDIYWARNQVAERFNAVAANLPESADGGLAPITSPLGEMFMFTVEGPLSLSDKRTLLDWVIRPQLRALPGVADVNSLGGEARSLEVVPDMARLAARSVSLTELSHALQANNRADGAGRIASGAEAILVRSDAAFRNEDDVRATVVALRGGQTIRVGDVAQVRIGALTRYGAVTRNGADEAVEGLVLGLRGANARQVVDGVRAKLDEIQAALPKGTTLVPFYDRGRLVERAVGTVGKALLEATALVLVLLFLFLGNVRAALCVALILPLSALATFLAMRWAGLSANLMSLGGLAIAIGLLVDAAVVVVENVEARFAHARPGRHRLSVIYRAAREVAAPVTAGIGIIIIVFLPLLTLQGLEGKLFVPVALSIVFALAASLLLSLTVIPVLASWLIRGGAHDEPWLARQAHAAYAPLLDRALRHPAKVTLGAVAILAAAVATFPFLGRSFMPTLDEGDLIVQLEKLPSIGLAETTRTDLAVQRALMKAVPEVRGVVARVGSDELGLDPMGLNQTDTFLQLAPREAWRDPDKGRLVDAIRAELQRFAGVSFAFTQPIEMRVSEMLSGTRGDLALKIFGPDLATLSQLAERSVRILQAIDGAEDVLTVRNDGVEYLRADVDRAALGRLGLTAQDVQDDLRALVEGRPLGVVLDAGRRHPVLLRAGDANRGSLAAFAQLTLPAPGGEAVPLTQLVRLTSTSGPVRIDREAGNRYAVVQANVRGRDLVGFVDEARARIEQDLALPDGYRLTWSGQFENQQRAAARLAVVVPVALALILLLLFATFGSLRQALLVFGNIPFALVGGVFALALSGEYLSVPASVGFIALMGIAVLNGLVMVSHFNHLAATGLPLDTVVREGAQRRLRPVLMTASITAFGLIPLLLASGPGAEIQRPLAIVVVGGLVSATLLTLLLLPMLYRRFGLAPCAATEPDKESLA